MISRNIRKKFSFGEFIRVGEGLLPQISMAQVVDVLCSEKRHSAIARLLVRGMLDSGLLSWFPDGNFSALSSVCNNLSANPHYNGRDVYFTLRDDCVAFSQEAYGLLWIEQHGKYPLPRGKVPTSRSWREIKLKVMRGGDSDLLRRLVSGKLLTRERGFDVGYDKRPDDFLTMLNMRTLGAMNLEIYNFPSRQVALSYARSLPVLPEYRDKIKVVNGTI